MKARARSRYRRICYGGGHPPEDGLRRFEFLLAAHLTFIIADIFFRLAALIAFRPVDFFETGATFLGSGLTFCFATKRLFWLRLQQGGLRREPERISYCARRTHR